MNGELAKLRTDVDTLTTRVDDLTGVYKSVDRDLVTIKALQQAHTRSMNALHENQGLHSRKLDALDTTLHEVSQSVGALMVQGQEHGGILAEHSAVLAEHSTVLAEHSTVLAEHTTTLAGHTTTLAEHGDLLREILRRLPELA